MSQNIEPVKKGTWVKIPGYESDGSESEDEEETRLKQTAQARLKDVSAILGSEWTAVPRMEFTPVSASSIDASTPAMAPMPVHAAPLTAPPSQWGNFGPPPKFRIERIRAPLVRHTFEQSGLTGTAGPDWMVQWSGPGMKEAAYNKLHEYQKVNHFPGSYELTRKDRLWAHFHQMERKFGKEAFDFVPETYVLPGQVDQFLHCYHTKDHIWIVKPNASSQGKGIFLLRDMEDLPLSEVSVVSRYVDNPLLIQGLKFDLRIYVLVTSYEPLRAYVYREGLTRFASQPYSTKEEHLNDKYRHLTNYSINKKAGNFVENQKLKADNVGHKWSLSALNLHLRALGVDVDLMWTRIMDLLVKSLMSVEPTIASRTKEATPNVANCFELYGFDVLVDDKLKPWLLEVNLSPCMVADSPLDWQVKSSLLCDTFNLVGIYRADMQAVAAARMRQKLVQVRQQMGLLDPLNSRTPGTNTMGAPVSTHHAGIQEGEDPTSILRMLTREQLKALAHALDEVGHRSRNFIRLHPTRNTVKRYGALMGRRMKGHFDSGGWSSARLFSALIFGTPLPARLPNHSALCIDAARRSLTNGFGAFGNSTHRELSPTSDNEERREKAEAAPHKQQPHAKVRPLPPPEALGIEQEQPGEDVENSDAGTPTGAVISGPPPPPMKPDIEATEAVMRMLQRFGARGGSRLLFLEYLLRVANACNGLRPSERSILAEGASAERLKAFRQQLAIYLRTRAGASGSLYMATARSPLGLSDASDLVEQLADTCDVTLTCMQRDAWGPRGVAELENTPVKRGHDSLARHCPEAFCKSSNGRAAIEGLAGLSAVDLEWLLRHHLCATEFSALLEQCIDVEQEASGWIGLPTPSRSKMSAEDIQKRIEDCWGVPRGPLSEILQKVRPRQPGAPRPRRKRDIVKEEELSPVRAPTPPRLMAEDSEVGPEEWPNPKGEQRYRTLAHKSRSSPVLPSMPLSTTRLGDMGQPFGGREYGSSFWSRKPNRDRLPSLPNKGFGHLPSLGRNIDIEL